MALTRRQHNETNGTSTGWGLTGMPRIPSLFQEVDQLFNQLASPGYAAGQWSQGFPIDLYETDEELVLNMAVAGISSDDLDVSVENRELTIRGVIPQPENEDRRYWVQTIPYGEFRRSLTLPTQVDLDNIEASVKDGMLTLRMPKAQHVRARKIAVNAR